MHADRNGHFYVLDRTNGAFLSGTPFIHQTWNKGFDEKGRPMPVPGSNSSPEGSILVYPTARRRDEFPGAVLQPDHRLVLSGVFRGRGAIHQRAAGHRTRPRVARPRAGGRGGPPRAARTIRRRMPGSRPSIPETGKTMWDFKLFQGSLANGVLATAGNVLFASSRDGNIIALDAKTGKHLWHYQTGGNHAASPISYAIDGRQYVALTAGNMLFSFTLPE